MVWFKASVLMVERDMSARETVVAILTDVHFWIPAGVLGAGVALLVYLR